LCLYEHDFSTKYFPGSGRNTLAALQWVANNSFQGRLGDRPEVENLVVLIASGEVLLLVG